VNLRYVSFFIKLLLYCIVLYAQQITRNKTLELFHNLCERDHSAWISCSSNVNGEHKVGAQQRSEAWVHQANIELFVGCAWKRSVERSNRRRQLSLTGKERHCDVPKTYNNSSSLF